MNTGRNTGIFSRNSLIRLFILIVLFLSVFSGAKALRLDTADPSTRMLYHAMPMALSWRYFNWPHNYTANFSIAMDFQNPAYKTFADKVGKAMARDRFEGAGQYFWNVDDRGLGDYAILSLILFGASLKGLFYFYFILLMLTVGAFWVGLRKSADAHAYCVVLLAGLLTCLPIWPNAPGVADFAEVTVHLSESRLFGLLALFPAAHMLLFARQSGRIGRVELICLLGQVGFFVFLFHARSSIIWQVGALLLLFAAQAGWQYVSTRKLSSRIAVCAGVFAISVFVLLPIYQRVVYHKHYFGEEGARTVWHNMVIGMMYSPVFGKNQIGDDATAIRLVLEREKALRHPHDPNYTVPDQLQKALNSLGSHNRYDWRGHEAAAKDYLLATLREHPWTFIKLYVYEKPRAILLLTKCHLALPGLDGGCKPAWRAWPWIGFSMVLVFAVAVLQGISGDRGARYNELTWITFFLSLCALLPPIVFYPSLVTNAEWLMCIVVMLLLQAHRLGINTGGRLQLSSQHRRQYQ